jgi:probable 2-oxoglutarate dehydrogenase E1 component DHKTD1
MWRPSSLRVQPDRHRYRLLRSSPLRELHDNGVWGYQQPREFALPDFTPEQLENRARNPSLTRLVDSYRRHGHRAATLDPLNLTHRPAVAALDPRRYGFAYPFDLPQEFTSANLPANSPQELADPERTFDTDGIFYLSDKNIVDGRWKIGDIVKRLQEVYCGTLGFEFMHIQVGLFSDMASQSLERSLTYFVGYPRLE